MFHIHRQPPLLQLEIEKHNRNTTGKPEHQVREEVVSNSQQEIGNKAPITTFTLSELATSKINQWLEWTISNPDANYKA